MSEHDNNAKMIRKKAPLTEAESTAERLRLIREIVAPKPLAEISASQPEKQSKPKVKTAPEQQKKSASAPKPAIEAAKKPSESAQRPTKETQPEVKMPDPVALGQAFLNLWEKSQPLLQDYMARVKFQPQTTKQFPAFSTEMLTPWLDYGLQFWADPHRFFDAQLGLWENYLKLWQNSTARFLGRTAAPVIEPATSDRRFADAAWSENVLFDFFKQSYLLTAQWLQQEVRDLAGDDPTTARKMNFIARQFVDALAPSNFLLTNPEVLRLTAESGGENLIKGLQNLLQDLERGQGKLQISMSDDKAFALGKNLALSKGKVVFRNAMMELIQYEPLTPQVAAAPLLIIPPWINKFYILDMREKNSFVRYCLEQGHTVFMISWVNPDGSYADKDFTDYMLSGPYAALQEIGRRTGAESANIVGYCLGGTLLACMLAWLTRRAEAAKAIPKIASATYLVTLIDFKEPGELGIFVEEDYLRHLEAMMAEKGYLDGATMAQTFSMLRANDLIWSFVVNNYLLGREPFPFDLLYWNADSTRMPAAMHSFYLRQMYQQNNLVKPDGIKLDNTPIDLKRITTPSFLLSTREDHIAPWASTYAATRLYQGEVRFVLSGSGHIAGVVNPPTAEKYGYWCSDNLPAHGRADLPDDPQSWLQQASYHAGSWWPHWQNWLREFQGETVPARAISEPTLGDAPGGYVKVKSV
jgi:polyhydroxyalkanoate synthase subunit PhaC